MRFSVLSAFSVFSTTSLLAEPRSNNVTRADGLTIKVQRQCWTLSDCARRCRNEWRNYRWSSAEDCIRNFPCSKYPRTCR